MVVERAIGTRVSRVPPPSATARALDTFGRPPQTSGFTTGDGHSGAGGHMRRLSHARQWRKGRTIRIVGAAGLMAAMVAGPVSAGVAGARPAPRDPDQAPKKAPGSN